ncbi:MAG: beta-propeller fold lactonase family protein [Terriglobales bacterium]
MSKRTGGVVALVGMCALSLLLVNCGSSSNRPAGLLYVISQAFSPPNVVPSVSSFAIDLNSGVLSLVNSNATTCTTLTQNPSVSCGLAVNILLDPTGATAFVLNQGLSPTNSTATVAPTIYGYTVNSDGSLSSPTTAQTLPLGDTSVTMTENAAGTMLFVLDVGPTLTPADCPTPGTATYGTDCPSILVYNATPGSTTLSQASAYPLSSLPTSLSVMTFTPPNGGSTQTLLFVTSNKDLTGNQNDNQLMVFSVDSSGNLKPQISPLNLPYYTTLPNPMVVQAVNTNPPPQTTGGVFVFVGSQGSVSGSVSVFQICTVVGQGSGVNTCNPQEVAVNQLIPVGTPSAAGNTPAAMVVDPTNSFLYVVSSGSNQLFAFQISTGTGVLSPLSPANQPTGATPVALAMQTSFDALDNFLYTSNSTGESITGFAASATTGQLSTSSSTTLFTPGLPSGMAAR